MPTFMRQGRRITDSQAKSSLEIAVIRVHVERVIRRLKTFLVLSFIRHDMNHLMNKIIIILSFTVNCLDPLIRDEKQFDEVTKQFMAEDDSWMANIPDDFMPDMDPLDITNYEQSEDLEEPLVDVDDPSVDLDDPSVDLDDPSVDLDDPLVGLTIRDNL